MTDNISISYSYQPPTVGGQPGTNGGASVSPPLYAVADCERVDCRNGGVLLIDRHSDRQLMVTPEVSTALAACREFRTLQEHAAHLAASIPELAGQEAEVVAVLETIRDAGLLTTAETALQRLSTTGPATAAVRAPSRVAIITCDRPDALIRLLDSMAANGDLGLHEQFFVIDDSRDPAAAAANRQAVERFNATTGQRMAYLGREAQRAMLDGLLAALPEYTEGIGFLLDSERWSTAPTHGLARSMALLFSLGRRLVVMDDDVLCRVVTSPQHRSGLLFGGKPRQVEAYPSQDAMTVRTQPADFDPMAGHCRLLGGTVAEVIADSVGQTPSASLLLGADATALSQWSADTPVILTQSGSLGDPGTVGVDWLYLLDADSARRVLASPEGLEGALAERCYWMGQPCPLLTRMAVISQVTGLDNSQLLPPYFPAFRGEDYLFGAMVEYLHPGAATLEYPWSVPHLPLQPRSGGGGAPEALAKMKPNPAKYITDHTLYESGIPAASRLRQLGSLFAGLAEMDDRSLLNLYRKERVESLAGRMQQLQAVLADGVERPADWRSHVEAAVASVTAAMQSPSSPAEVYGVADGSDNGALLTRFRQYAGGFSAALAAWPAVRALAPGIAEELIARSRAAG